MSAPSTESPASTPRPWLWALLFVAAMFSVAAADIYDRIGEPWHSILSIMALSLVVPMVISARRKARAEGNFSPALRVYNNRCLAAIALYMLTFIIAAGLYDSVAPGSATMWLLALVPVVPLLGTIWAMQRYLAEETDEYLRHRATQTALFGLALVLVLGTVWGFLETFGLAPHVWSWWVFPVWSIGMGLGQAWMKVRGR